MIELLLYVLYQFTLPLASMKLHNYPYHHQCDFKLVRYIYVFFLLVWWVGNYSHVLLWILLISIELGILSYVHEYSIVLFCKFPVHILCWFFIWLFIVLLLIYKSFCSFFLTLLFFWMLILDWLCVLQMNPRVHCFSCLLSGLHNKENSFFFFFFAAAQITE